jgi:hypothetical protein
LSSEYDCLDGAGQGIVSKQIISLGHRMDARFAGAPPFAPLHLFLWKEIRWSATE